MKKISNIFILFFILIYSGCYSSKAKNVYPQWFNSVKQDSPIFYYNVDEGDSKQDAITRALNGIASRVSVSVQSTFKSSTTSSDGVYSHTVNQNIQNKVKKIEFSSYKILKSKVLPNNKVIVSISVNRVDNAQIMLDKVNMNIKQYKKVLNASSNLATKIKQYSSILHDIDSKMLPQCFISKSLYSTDDVDVAIKQLNDIKVQVQKFLNNITFKIVSNGNISGYKEVIVEKLSSKHMTLVQDQASDLIISIKVQETQLKSLGKYIIKSKIKLTVSANNDVVGEKELITGGSSQANYNQAREFAIQNFKKKLEQENILKTLIGI